MVSVQLVEIDDFCSVEHAQMDVLMGEFVQLGQVRQSDFAEYARAAPQRRRSESDHGSSQVPVHTVAIDQPGVMQHAKKSMGGRFRYLGYGGELGQCRASGRVSEGRKQCNRLSDRRFLCVV
ncbi:hypothetical protein A5630_21285 [Mycolicibacterium mucogenicum]|uniref:Uncharacterized protein n=1 Tax=Mycolicibacterium mucogenicum TaxID=56689 RepID=A0A1A3H3P0_MYCMU|nr:hypothetical protein A5630_21285 [Mycolicibacterium mucogenicum]